MPNPEPVGYHAELLQQIRELEELAYQRGYLMARIEQGLQLVGALEEAATPVPVKVDGSGVHSTRQLIRDLLQEKGKLSTEEVIRAVQATVPTVRPSAIRSALWSMKKDGLIDRYGPSVYGPPRRKLVEVS